MRSKVAKRMLAKTPKETKIFVAKYADIVVRVNELIREKGYTQKSLAESIGKKPSEISKWLSGEHNFTLRSIAKLEAELDESIINVVKPQPFVGQNSKNLKMTVHSNVSKQWPDNFTEGQPMEISETDKLVS